MVPSSVWCRQEKMTDVNAPEGAHTYAELEALSVLSVGQADDLHIEDRTRHMRVWLSREPPYVVEIEHWTFEAGWTTTDRYPAR